jgi:hypothetical protein
MSFGPSVEVGGSLSEVDMRDRYEPPTYEIICLACEISAYAPDGDTPLF